MIHHVRHVIIGLLCLCAAVNQVNATECSVGESITFVPRVLWGASPPSSIYPLSNPVDSVEYRPIAEPCSDSEACASTVKSLQDFYTTSNPDINFNFLIGGDFKVYEGTGWQRYSAQSASGAVYIGLIGATTPVADGMLDTLRKLLRVGVAFGHITANYSFCGSGAIESWYGHICVRQS